METRPVSAAPGRIGPTGAGMFGSSASSGTPRGMFGNSAAYAPSLNPADFASRTYDYSGIKKGAEELSRINPLNITTYNPYNFTEYGQSSPSEISNVYNQAYTAGAKPIQSQANARMQGLSQGFGANRFQGGQAQRTQGMRNSMQAGSDLTNLSSQISSQLADRSLTQSETARQNNFANQGRQAAENFQSAGYNANAAKTMSDQAMQKAGQLLNYGFQLPQLQMSMNQAGMQPYNTLYDQTMKMAGTTVPPGTNVQSVGGK